MQIAVLKEQNIFSATAETVKAFQWDTACIRSSPDPSVFAEVSLACETAGAKLAPTVFCA